MIKIREFSVPLSSDYNAGKSIGGIEFRSSLWLCKLNTKFPIFICRFILPIMIGSPNIPGSHSYCAINTHIYMLHIYLHIIHLLLFFERGRYFIMRVPFLVQCRDSTRCFSLSLSLPFFLYISTYRMCLRIIDGAEVESLLCRLFREAFCGNEKRRAAKPAVYISGSWREILDDGKNKRRRGRYSRMDYSKIAYVSMLAY